MDVVRVVIPGLPGPMRAGGGNPTSQEFDLVHGGVWSHGYRTRGRRRGGLGWNPASNSEGGEGFVVREVQGRRAPLN